jgi:hypothetical protein
MNRLVDLGRGVNIGGWISQSDLSETHIRAFFTQKDVEKIAGWGFQNIRLPFDYPLVEDDASPGKYKEDGFAWIDLALDWSAKAGLKVVLDMHKAPGFQFIEVVNDPHAVPRIFTEQSLRQRYYDLWAAVARRYLGRHEHVVFELLNEVTAPQADQWNDLAAGAVAAIRSVDKPRPIVVGSNMWNGCQTFPELRHFDDPNVLYTFHFYEPIAFTHQKARWTPELYFLNEELSYPGRPMHVREMATKAAAEGKTGVSEKLMHLADTYDQRGPDDANYLRLHLAPVLDFCKKYNVQAYCGEFGVYSRAPHDSAIRWYADAVALFDENGIDYSAWSYKGMGFGLVDKHDKLIRPEALAILRGDTPCGA